MSDISVYCINKYHETEDGPISLDLNASNTVKFSTTTTSTIDDLVDLLVTDFGCSRSAIRLIFLSVRSEGCISPAHRKMVTTVVHAHAAKCTEYNDAMERLQRENSGTSIEDIRTALLSRVIMYRAGEALSIDRYIDASTQALPPPEVLSKKPSDTSLPEPLPLLSNISWPSDLGQWVHLPALPGATLQRLEQHRRKLIAPPQVSLRPLSELCPSKTWAEQGLAAAACDGTIIWVCVKRKRSVVELEKEGMSVYDGYGRGDDDADDNNADK
jgi:hypothetical protein